MRAIRLGILPAQTFHDPRLESVRFGVRFPNPVGLAAGFDKNGVALSQWARFGFGFVEAGTVTHVAQPGNPKPRMFRVPENQGLINRMGFNNEGAAALAGRLQRPHPPTPLPQDEPPGGGGGPEFRSASISGSRRSRNWRTLRRTTRQATGCCTTRATTSWSTCRRRTRRGYGPFRTPGALREILAAMREVDATRPLFVKVAPDLTFDALDELAGVAIEARLTGIVATNTTILPRRTLERSAAGGRAERATGAGDGGRRPRASLRDGSGGNGPDRGRRRHGRGRRLPENPIRGAPRAALHGVDLRRPGAGARHQPTFVGADGAGRIRVAGRGAGNGFMILDTSFMLFRKRHGDTRAFSI